MLLSTIVWKLDMTVTLREIAPSEIEQESFRIIREEFGPINMDESSFRIIQRVIHATGDFSFGSSIQISPGAIDAGIEAIHSGRNILTDVTMVAAGISKTMLGSWGGEVFCRVADPQIAELAKAQGKTRSEVAMEQSLDDSIGIVAIGNAPTALIEIVRLLEKKKLKQPPLVIGVPVGFVNAAESKEFLMERNNLYITSRGRKGGSPVAAAMVNALLRLAL